MSRSLSSTPALTLGLVVSLATAACSSDEASKEPSEPEEYLGLTEPSDGFQLRSVGTSIPAGADVEFCEVGELPDAAGETFAVRSVEFGNAAFSHHMGVSVTIAGSEADTLVRELDVGDQVPCVSAETAFSPDGMERVGGTLQRYNRIDYPEGVGREYHGGQRVVFDYHYYNTSTDAVPALSAVNFHLADGGVVSHLARGFQFNNWMIDTPPGEKRSFVGECRFSQDVKLGGITRHTHRWGKDYSVWFAGGERDGEHLWTSTDWQHQGDFGFDVPLLMKSGEGFRFQCDYDNTETHALRFGLNATDEMCILFGLLWNAGEEKDVVKQDCDIVWTDAEGVARAASDGGFPAATESEVALCLNGAAQAGTEPDDCTKCRCDGCGGALLRCATDADCGPILTCLQETPDACLEVVDAHSSGVGLATQLRVCLEHSACTTCDAATTAN